MRASSGLPDALGLDIGHGAVRLVDLQRGRLAQWAEVPLPERAVTAGAVADAAAVSHAVRQVLSTANARGRGIVSGVPGPACFIRRLQFPDMAAKDLQRAIRWEAERLLPYPFDDAAVDYDVLVRRDEGGKPVAEVVLVGARAEVVEGFRSAIESAGAKLIALDAVPLARLRAYRDAVRAPGALLVHLGTRWTELTAADASGLVFTRSVPTGQATDTAGGGAAGPRSLVEEVMRSVRFFETQAGTQVAAVLLTGDGAEDPRAVEAFAGADLPPVGIVDPLAQLARDSAAPPASGLKLAAAFGLAVREPRAPSVKEAPWR